MVEDRRAGQEPGKLCPEDGLGHSRSYLEPSSLSLWICFNSQKRIPPTNLICACSITELKEVSRNKVGAGGAPCAPNGQVWYKMGVFEAWFWLKEGAM